MSWVNASSETQSSHRRPESQSNRSSMLCAYLLMLSLKTLRSMKRCDGFGSQDDASEQSMKFAAVATPVQQMSGGLRTNEN